MGTTGPASLEPGDRRPYALDFPVVTIRDMVRAQALLLDRLGIETCSACSAARWAACRCCNGRRAIPSASSPPCRSPTAARHSAQNIAFHEVGRQAVMADPDWRGGRYLERGAAARQGARASRAWARTSPICRSGAAPQVRPQPPGPRRADLLLRRRFPDRELPALPGPGLRRALRRQLLSLCHARDGLLRPRGRLRRRPRRRVPGHQDALLRDLVHLRLAVPDIGFARHRARAQRRGAPRSASSRSRATRATTPFCSTSRRCSPTRAASSTRRRGRAA